jgi:hypothetical protein
LLTHAWQRRRGHTEAGSWAAQMVARICGTVIVALVVSSWPAATGAAAATPRPAPDPVPQKAPTSGAASQPTPDPAPQVRTTSPASPRSTPISPTIRVPVVVTPPRTVSAVMPPRTVSAVTPPRTASAPAAKIVIATPRPAQPVRPTASPHVRAARAPAPHRARPQATRLSFPLALPKDLLLLPGRALHAGETGHRDGVLLLLTSLAMAGLAVASFALMRRLKGLELR